MEEISGLKVAVDKARAEQKEALDEAEIATNRLVIVNKTADELRARITALEADRSDVSLGSSTIDEAWGIAYLFGLSAREDSTRGGCQAPIGTQSGSGVTAYPG